MDTEMSTKPVDVDEFLTNIEKKDLTAEEKKILDEFIKSFNASLSQPQKENPDECAMQIDDPEPKEQDRKEESVKEPEIPTLTLTPPLDEEEEKEVAEQAKVQLPKNAFGKNETKGDLLRMLDKVIIT
ncbi:hypothetical protein C0J52_07526 [Blattella germanica]|nr:hypothetical protein C0J52_07526 [Blattella germanica]